MIWLAILLIGLLSILDWNLMVIGRRSEERIEKLLQTLGKEKPGEGYLSVVWN